MLIMSTLLLMLIKVIFQNTRRIKSFFPYKDRLNRSELSKVICKGNCWDCKDFYIGKTKRRLYDRKTEHFKALLKHDHSSTIADHVKTTGHNIKWDHFDTLASGKTDYYCKVKETLFIQELQPAVKSFYSIKEAFLLSLYRQFLFEMSWISIADVLYLGSRSHCYNINSFPKIYNGYTFENVCWLAYKTSSL